jgi:hypothetical protein
MFDPVVLRTKTSYLQRAADLVRLGYRWHVSGVVPLERCAVMVRKFRDVYLTHLGKDARYRRKRVGLGNAHLLLWRSDSHQYQICWTLLCTEGDHAAHRLEPNLRNAYDRKCRLVITDYELVLHDRAAPRAGGGHMVPAKTARLALSWRMTKEREIAYRNEFRDLIRGGRVCDLARHWSSLHRVPGFALLRRQVFEIRAFARSEWKRHKAGKFPIPGSRIPYVSRVGHWGLPLSAVIRMANRQQRLEQSSVPCDE